MSIFKSIKNDFGGYTHEIIVTQTLMFKFIETDPYTINVEFIKKGFWGNEKIISSYTSQRTLIMSIINAFGKIMFNPQVHKVFKIDVNYINQFEDKVLDYMAKNSKEISEKSIVKFD